MEENKDLIHLQNAHVTQYTDNDGKSKWKVRKNITSEDLYELPNEWKESMVFEALHFAREFEIEAFNIGINFGKTTVKNEFDREREMYKKVISDLTEANERLSEKLGQLIGEEIQE